MQAIFADIASSPLPERLASLMRSWSADGAERLGEEADHGASAAETSNRVDLEDGAELRSLTAALFEDEQVETIECDSAEATLATLLIGGPEVAMIFADVRLRGVMDGIDLAREVKMRWPLPVILTCGHPRERVGELPVRRRLHEQAVAATQRADRRRRGPGLSGVTRLP